MNVINASPQPGPERNAPAASLPPPSSRKWLGRVVLSALACFLLVAAASRPASASVKVEQWNASLSLRLRTDDAIQLAVQEVRGSALLALDPRLALFVDGSVYEGDGSYPELYLRYQSGAQAFRLGRFYLPLGIHDYSELYYVGFISAPLLKFYGFRGVVSYRSEQGFAWQARSGRWEWETALVGDDGSQAALGLERPRGIVGRTQTAVGRLVLGLNGYTGDEPGPQDTREVRWYGLDGRFSIPEWVFRGEAFRGSSGGEEIYGYYLDALYHPDALPAWTFLGRLEAVRGRGLNRRYTVGARVVLRRGWTLSANWIDNQVRFPSRSGGLNLQLQHLLQY